MMRHAFGDEGEFVDVPIVAGLNRDWEDGRLQVFKHEEREEGMTLRGTLVHRVGPFGMFSCGGLLVCAKDVVTDELSVSVVPAAVEK